MSCSIMGATGMVHGMVVMVVHGAVAWCSGASYRMNQSNESIE